MPVACGQHAGCSYCSLMVWGTEGRLPLQLLLSQMGMATEHESRKARFLILIIHFHSKEYMDHVDFVWFVTQPVLFLATEWRCSSTSASQRNARQYCSCSDVSVYKWRVLASRWRCVTASEVYMKHSPSAVVTISTCTVWSYRSTLDPLSQTPVNHKHRMSHNSLSKGITIIIIADVHSE